MRSSVPRVFLHLWKGGEVMFFLQRGYIPISLEEMLLVSTSVLTLLTAIVTFLTRYTEYQSTNVLKKKGKHKNARRKYQ